MKNAKPDEYSHGHEKAFIFFYSVFKNVVVNSS
jgi:hypothetical protein